VSLFDGKAGETVIVEFKTPNGTDSHNNPTYDTQGIAVDYVLVAPGSLSDIREPNRPDGHLVRYTLYFPKTFGLKLEGTRINVRDDWCAVIGSPAHYDHALTPGAWSMVVEVEKADG
jgi:hypothetical protein